MWLDCPVEETDDGGRKTRTTEARDKRRGIPVARTRNDPNRMTFVEAAAIDEICGSRAIAEDRLGLCVSACKPAG